MTQEQLIEKIKTLKPSEIIMAMVNGLKKKHIKIDMNTFGKIKERSIIGISLKPICYGCAATNTLIELNGKFDISLVKYYELNRFLQRFETAIDYLRLGYLAFCNEKLLELKLPQIKFEDYCVVPLNNTFTKEDLKGYIALAEYNARIEDSKNW